MMKGGEEDDVGLVSTLANDDSTRASTAHPLRMRKECWSVAGVSTLQGVLKYPLARTLRCGRHDIGLFD